METYGWDTVFATTVEHVNAALVAERDKLVSAFSFALEGYRLDGVFDAFRVVPGGAGKLLHVELPIRSGRLVDPNQKSVDLAGVSVFVEIALTLLPAPSQPRQQQLRFDVNAADAGTSGGGTVAALRVVAPPGRLGSLQQAVLMKAVPMCLMANAAGLTFVFSTISLVDSGSNSPLSPVQSAFHYAELSNGRGYFSILAATDSRDVSRLDHKVDPSLLSDGPSGFYALSSDSLMKAVVLPTLPRIFAGTTPQTFVFNPQNHGIQNTGPIATASVQSGAITYYPVIQSLLLTPFNDGIACSINGSCDMGLGITCTFAMHAQNKLVYDAATNGLNFQRDPSPTVTHDFQIPWYDYFIPGIVGIGDAILALVVDLVANGIGDGLQKASMQFSLARDVPQAVRWAGMDAFHAEGAGMANAFFMRGKLV